MPNGRRRPSAFGMYRRSTGAGRYRPVLRSPWSSSRKAATPRCSMAAIVSSSTPCSALLCSYPPPRFPQDVTPVDPVVQRVEPPPPMLLGCPPQRPLEFSHFVHRVVGAYAHALALTPMRTRDQSRGPSLQALVPPFLGTSAPSDSLPTPRRFGLALSTRPCSNVSRRVGPLQFRTGPWTRAAPRTPEESSAAPIASRCLLPSPWHARLGLLCLSADHLTRRQDSRDVAARALAPSVEARDAPLGAADFSPTLGPATELPFASRTTMKETEVGCAMPSAPRSATTWCDKPVTELDPKPRAHLELWPRARRPESTLGRILHPWGFPPAASRRR